MTYCSRLSLRACCTDDDFAFTGKNRKVFARINRAELGDFDALVLGLFLMAHYKDSWSCLTSASTAATPTRHLFAKAG